MFVDFILNKWKSTYIFLFLSTLTWFMYSLTRAIMPPLLPYIGLEFNLNHWQLGFLLTVFFLPYALMQLPSGILSDRIGYKKLIIIGLIISSIGSILTSFVKSYNELIFYRFLTGLGQSTLFAPSMALLTEYFPKKRGKSISIYGIGMSIGNISAPLIASFLFDSINWRIFFLIVAIPEIFIAIAFWKFVKEVGNSKLMLKEFNLIENIREGFTKPVIILIIVYSINISVQGIMSFLPDYLIKQLGLSFSLANSFYSIIPVTGFFSMLFAGFLSDKFERKNLIIFSWLINLTLITSIAFACSYIQILIIFIIYGLLSAIPNIALYAFFGDVISSNIRGVAYGLLNLTGMLSGQSLTPLIIGYLIDSIGYRMTMASWSITLGLCSIVLLFSIKSRSN